MQKYTWERVARFEKYEEALSHMQTIESFPKKIYKKNKFPGNKDHQVFVVLVGTPIKVEEPTKKKKKKKG